MNEQQGVEFRRMRNELTMAVKTIVALESRVARLEELATALVESKDSEAQAEGSEETSHEPR